MIPPSCGEDSGRVVFREPGIELRALDGGYVLAYSDGTRFRIDPLGTQVWGGWVPPLTLEDAATYLLGPVLAFVLRLRNVLCLHASVVVLGGKSAAIMGGAEAGKSTLAAALALRGHRVASDDVAPVVERDGALHVLPSYPGLRLWPDSVSVLLGSSETLPRLAPDWDKRLLDVGERGLFEGRPTPLDAVFALDDRVVSASAPRIEPLGPREAFTAVLGHLHTAWMLPAEPQAPVFRFVERLVSRLPVFRLVPHSDPDRLRDLCACVEARMSELGPGGVRPV